MITDVLLKQLAEMAQTFEGFRIPEILADASRCIRRLEKQLRDIGKRPDRETRNFAYFFTVGASVVWSAMTEASAANKFRLELSDDELAGVLDFIQNANPGEFREVVFPNNVRAQLLCMGTS